MKLILALILGVAVGPAADRASAQVFEDGDFADPTGGAWSFEPAGTDASVTFGGGATIVGPDDGQGAFAYVHQDFSTIPGATETIQFDWQYSSSDAPGYDGAMWDLVDRDLGTSAIGGPLFLTTSTGESGGVDRAFSGNGSYQIRLGTWSQDGILGAGIAAYFDATISGTGIVGKLFVRTDANDDGVSDISDAVRILYWLYVPESPGIACEDAADADDDGAITLADAVSILTTFLAAGPPPIAPWPACGIDPSRGDGLRCRQFDGCP